jgi:hypothetical protein
MVLRNRPVLSMHCGLPPCVELGTGAEGQAPTPPGVLPSAPAYLVCASALVSVMCSSSSKRPPWQAPSDDNAAPPAAQARSVEAFGAGHG